MWNGTAWSVNDALTGEVIAVEACGDLNITHIESLCNLEALLGAVKAHVNELKLVAK